jgi:hypothetical protein
MRRAVVAILAGALAIGGVSGCAKREIDVQDTGSVDVPGTNGTLKKFCDGSILIYWTPSIASGEDDDYEFIVYDGCTPDGKIINGRDINPGTPEQAPTKKSQEPTADLDAGEDE